MQISRSEHFLRIIIDANRFQFPIICKSVSTVLVSVSPSNHLLVVLKAELVLS